MEPKQHPERIIESQSDHIGSGEAERHSSRRGAKKRIRSKKLFLIPLCGLVLIGVLVAVLAAGGSASLVPKKIQKSVDFPIYYPASLPAGYTLDIPSFQLAEAGVVLFTVSDSNGKDIVFSEQQQPSTSDMDKFISSYLPLNSVLQLPLGQAKVGAYGSAPNIRTVLSLPIRNGPWLIVTAPSDVNHDDLASILKSLTK